MYVYTREYSVKISSWVLLNYNKKKNWSPFDSHRTAGVGIGQGAWLVGQATLGGRIAFERIDKSLFSIKRL